MSRQKRMKQKIEGFNLRSFQQEMASTSRTILIRSYLSIF